MKGYQDRYFEQVTQHFGMERLSDTPRKRLSRSAWKEQKTLDKIINQRNGLEQLIEKLESTHEAKMANLDKQFTDKYEEYKKQMAPLRAQVQQAQAEVQKITDTGGIQEWARKTAYAIIGKERPELAEARKILAEKTRKAEAAEAAAKQKMEQAQAEITRLRATLSSSQFDVKELKRDNQRMTKEVLELQEKVKQTADPAMKIQLLQAKLGAAERERDGAYSQAEKLEKLLNKFAAGEINERELKAEIRPKSKSNDFKM